MRGTLTLSPADEVRNRRARRAAEKFRRMQPTLSGFARSLTGRDDMRVIMDTGIPRTDGKVIYLKPPIELGDEVDHNAKWCDKRDFNHVPMCPACKAHEDVMITLYHEIAHIAFGSFEEVDEDVRTEIVARAVREAGAGDGTTRAAKIAKRIESMPGYAKSYIGAAKLISPFLPGIVNALEDVRVNRSMYSARPGTLAMFKGQAYRVFTEGIQLDDGTFRKWNEMPRNAQMVVGLFAKAARYDYTDWFSDEVVEALNDRDLTRLIAQLDTVRSARGVYELCFPVLERIRELGFCKAPDDPEDDPEPEPEPEPEPQPEQEQENTEPDNEDTGGDDDDESDEGEPADDGTPCDDGSPSDEPQDSEPTGDEGDTPDADGETPGEGAPSDDESDENDDESDDAESGGEPGEAGDTEQDDDADGESSDDGEPGSEGGTGDEDGDGGDSLDADADDAGTGSEDDTDAAGTGSGDADDDDDESDDDWDDDDESDSGSGSDDGDDADSDGSESTDGSDASEQADDASGSDGGDSTDGKSGSDTGATDTESGSGGGGLGDDESERPSGSNLPPEDEDFENEPEPEPEPEPIDDSELVERALRVFGGHEEPEPTPEEEADEEAVDKAVVQGEHFERPSNNIFGVRIHEYDKRDDDRMAESWNYPHAYNRDGVRMAESVPEAILGPSLMRMRVVFSDNRKSATKRNLKSGRVESRVLGKRIATGDERLFGKRQRPGKKDYFVLIGFDISGSTCGRTLTEIKEAVLAQAELCARTGVKFAVYAHTGNYHDPDSGRYSGMDLDIYVIKHEHEMWDTRTRERLFKLGPSAANIDGHTLEFYRKRCDESRATDKVILYYTDGSMPAENYDEELEILRREINTCRTKGYTLLGVGVGTDSPREHGLDTVLMESQEDTPTVVRHLEKRMTGRK